MELVDKYVNSNIIGALMQEPILISKYSDIDPKDFGDKTVSLIYATIFNLVKNGKKVLTPMDVENEISLNSSYKQVYLINKGTEFLVNAYSEAKIIDFDYNYIQLKKLALLRELKRAKYDISYFYKEEYLSLEEEKETIKRFQSSSIPDIINKIDEKYSKIREKFLNASELNNNNPSEKILDLIEELKNTPAVGELFDGKIFNIATRGARKGCFYLKSASSSTGKTRTSVFDACCIAYPEKYSFDLPSPTFSKEYDADGNLREPKKVLFIVTEMDKEELQTIMLAYISGVDEAKILTGRYELGEYERVKHAAEIIKKYEDYFYVEEISDPNLNNVSAVIKRYAVIEKVEYVFFDYIHSTGSLLGQFEKSGVGEHTMLMLLSNQLKQLAKDYKLFIFSATQVNATGMSNEDIEFKNELSIRGSKGCADKADCGYVITKISEKLRNVFNAKVVTNPEAKNILAQRRHTSPTHVIDLYKMRQGRFKNVRIWIWLDLSNGEREDLVMTDSDNNLIAKLPPEEKNYIKKADTSWKA